MTRTKWTNNIDCTIDSRDIIKRLQELGEAFDAWREEHPTQSPDEWEEIGEMNVLATLAKQGECAADWHHGETLIRDDYFTEYVRELLEDCGELPRDLPHYIAIDWDKTARNVRVDYFPIDFDGVTYWIR